MTSGGPVNLRHSGNVSTLVASLFESEPLGEREILNERGFYESMCKKFETVELAGH